MKFTFLSILLLSFSFSAYMPINEGKITKVNSDINSLISEGYSKEWSIKKALVENNIIKPDAEYYAIIED
jgi:hypothetical protein